MSKIYFLSIGSNKSFFTYLGSANIRFKGNPVMWKMCIILSWTTNNSVAFLYRRRHDIQISGGTGAFLTHNQRRRNRQILSAKPREIVKTNWNAPHRRSTSIAYLIGCILSSIPMERTKTAKAKCKTQQRCNHGCGVLI